MAIHLFTDTHYYTHGGGGENPALRGALSPGLYAHVYKGLYNN